MPAAAAMARAHQMGAAALPLTTLKVAVAGRGTTFAQFQTSAFIARHIEQPGSRHSKPAATKILVQTFGLSLLFHQTGSRNHHGQFQVRGHAAALDDSSRGAQILDARIGAGTDNTWSA